MGDNRYHSIFGGMKVHTTPCSVQCPANTDIPAYMERLREGDVEGAAHILMEANPIPMITSRVCAHTCQEQCNRCGSDESVSIHGVERYVGITYWSTRTHFTGRRKQRQAIRWL